MATTAFPVAGANNSKYYMNPQPGPSPPEQQQYGGPKPAFTTIDTALPNTNTTTPPSANVSPTNHHHMSAAVRHIRQPRQPLYVPAALRPSEYCARATDIPSRPRALDTPPSSKDNSLDSNNKTTTTTTTTSPPPTTTTNSSSSTTSLHRRAASAHPGSTTSPGSTHQHPFARPSSTGPATAGFQHANQNITLNTSESFLYNNPSNSSSASQATSRQSWTPTSWSSAADPITGPPTSAHWKPDESSPNCSVCSQKFSWFFRRHHCRRCGDVVCSAHSGKMVPLDQNARFHPRGLRVKVCDPCAGEWGVVRRVSIGSGAGKLTPTTSGASAAREGDGFGGGGGGGVEVDARPILGSGNRGLTREEEERERELRIGSLARSEGGMIWSTF